METALMSDIVEEIKAKIKTNIQDPVDALLASMKDDIPSKEGTQAINQNDVIVQVERARI
jgi:hypothetical protein